MHPVTHVVELRESEGTTVAVVRWRRSRQLAAVIGGAPDFVSRTLEEQGLPLCAASATVQASGGAP